MTGTRVSHLAVERLTPQDWRLTFDHGPIDTITAERRLGELVTPATAPPDGDSA